MALDDGYEPARCAENTAKFIDQDVLAMFGYIGTPTSLAALPFATKAKVPFIAPFGKADGGCRCNSRSGLARCADIGGGEGVDGSVRGL